MKNLLIYYSLILAPALLLMLFWTSIAFPWNLILFFSYALIYRTLLDGFRLFNKGVIQKNDIWKLALPGIRVEYLKELYFRK